jgi:hypothetical protein
VPGSGRHAAHSAPLGSVNKGLGTHTRSTASTVRSKAERIAELFDRAAVHHDEHVGERHRFELVAARLSSKTLDLGLFRQREPQQGSRCKFVA